MLKFILSFLVLTSCINHHAWSTNISLANFFKEFHKDSEVKKYQWSPHAYAVEKDYEEIFMLLLAEQSFKLWYYLPPLLHSQRGGDRTTVFHTIILKSKFELLKTAFEICLLNKTFQNSLAYEGKQLDAFFSDLLKFTIRMRISNSIDICQYLLTMGANPNDPTALVYCISSRNFELAQLLIDHGMDVNSGGKESLRSAIQTRNKEGMHFLIDKGTKVDISLIEYAATIGNDEILNFLVDAYYAQK